MSIDRYLSVRALTKTYAERRWWGTPRPARVALRDVSFTLENGQTLGVIGPSGSGKSTLARCLAGFDEPDSGEIRIEGRRVGRAEIQLIPQQPAASLNPRFTAGEIIAEPLVIQKRGDRRSRHETAARWMETVGLPPSAIDRPALQFSGGERQRLAIARALAIEPKVLILDESFAGLDLSIQLQIEQLLGELQARPGLTAILIAHDLALAASLSNEIAVMENGAIVEYSPAAELLAHPQHLLSRKLLEAARALSITGNSS